MRKNNIFDNIMLLMINRSSNDTVDNNENINNENINDGNNININDNESNKIILMVIDNDIFNQFHNYDYNSILTKMKSITQ